MVLVVAAAGLVHTIDIAQQRQLHALLPGMAQRNPPCRCSPTSSESESGSTGILVLTACSPMGINVDAPQVHHHIDFISTKTSSDHLQIYDLTIMNII